MKYNNEYDMRDVAGLFWKSNQTLQKKYLHKRINILWNNCVGETIAKYTQKVMLKDNVLTIYITNPIIKNELLLNRSKVMTLLNEQIGTPIVQQLQIL